MLQVSRPRPTEAQIQVGQGSSTESIGQDGRKSSTREHFRIVLYIYVIEVIYTLFEDRSHLEETTCLGQSEQRLPTHHL